MIFRAPNFILFFLTTLEHMMVKTYLFISQELFMFLPRLLIKLNYNREVTGLKCLVPHHFFGVPHQVGCQIQ